MYEYEIYNAKLDDHGICFGYDVEDMKMRNPKIDWNEWKIVFCEYVD